MLDLLGGVLYHLYTTRRSSHIPTTAVPGGNEMRAGLGEQEKGVLGSLRTAANDSELLSTPEVAGLAYSPAICHTGEDYIFAWVKHLPGEKRDELHVGAPGGDSRVVSASSAVLWPALALLTHNTLLISWIDGDNFEV